MEILIVVRWYLYIETVHRLQRRKHSNWPNSQSPQCTSLISHNAPFCNRNMHISVAKWCAVGYLSNALWADLWDWSITVTYLTHWGRMTHICVSKLTIISSDNGLPPDRRQAIIWTNAGLLLIRPLGTNFSEILIEILTFSFKKMRLKVSSAKRRPFCLGLNVLSNCHKRHGQPRHRYHISLAVWSAFYHSFIFHNTISGEIKHQPLIYM